MIHDAVQSVQPLCSEGELSGLFLIVHRQTQWHCSMLFHIVSVFAGPSSFSTWGCGGQCLSILGAVQSLIPPEWALCPGHSVVTFLGRLDPSQLWLQPQ
jgi:hypothetical protein